MDMHRTAKEIGLFLTAINLVAVMDSPDVQDKVGASMPLPDSDTEKKVSDIAKCLPVLASVSICSLPLRSH